MVNTVLNTKKTCTENIFLMLSTLGKIFSRLHIEIFFFFFPENRIRHFMQIVSNGDNLHEKSNPVFWENKKISPICRLLNWPKEW